MTATGPFVSLNTNTKWIATIAADEYIANGHVVNFFHQGRLVAAVSTEYVWRVASAMAGDPNVCEFGERKPVTP